MNRGQGCFFDAQVPVHDLRHRCDAVGCATGAAHDIVLARGFVHPKDHRFYAVVLGRGREDHLFGACFQMLFQILTSIEDARAIEHNVDLQVFPGQIGGVLFCVNFIVFPVQNDPVLAVLHFFLIAAVGGVVIDQVG